MVPARVHGVLLAAVHEHRRDAKEAVLRRGQRDLAAAVPVAVERGVGDPAFLETLADVFAEIFVVGVTGAVVGVEALLEIFAGCPARASR